MKIGDFCKHCDGKLWDKKDNEGFSNVTEYEVKDSDDQIRVFVIDNNTTFSVRDQRLINNRFFDKFSADAIKEVNDALSRTDVKTFFLVGINPEIITNDEQNCDYIVSIEFRNKDLFNYDVRSTKHIQMTRNTLDSVKEKLSSQKPFYRFELHTDQKSNHYGYFVFIKVKENGEFTDKYLNEYFICSDNRTYKENIYLSDFIKVGRDNIEPDKPSSVPHNLLIYGAPGTGKSHYIDNEFETFFYKEVFQADDKYTEEYFSELKEKFPDAQIENIQDLRSSIQNKCFTRVTFYEDYSYESFVGCYKPIMRANKDGEKKIEYDFEPGPFTNIYIKAKNDPRNNYILAIEELNRARAATVFGDLFQVLDRDENGTSEYSVKPEAALDHYLKENLESYDGTISLPPNLYIRATMNSADQGVNVLDSAFKRRWQFMYMDINNSQSSPKDDERKITLPIDDGATKEYAWWRFRTAINDILSEKQIEEDRWVGEWFFKDSELKLIEEFYKSQESTKLKPNPLVDKLLAYLLQDVVKTDPSILFKSEYHNMSSIRKALSASSEPKSIFEVLTIEIEEKNVEPKESDDKRSSGDQDAADQSGQTERSEPDFDENNNENDTSGNNT